MASDAIQPDTKDWTWVISQPCPDCGFDPVTLHHTEVGDRIRADAAEWVHRLGEPGVGNRDKPSVWSTLEYGCHIRDVHRIFNHRVQLMLGEDEPRFPNWDQDETAIADDYGSQDPAAVATELFEAANTVADTYATVPSSWAWCTMSCSGPEGMNPTVRFRTRHADEGVSIRALAEAISRSEHADSVTAATVL